MSASLVLFVVLCLMAIGVAAFVAGALDGMTLP